MTENENTLMDTVGSWFDTSEERRSALMGVGGMATLLGLSQVYAGIKDVYPDDAKIIAGTLGIGLAGTVFGGIYAYGRKTGQRDNEPVIVPQIDPEQIQQVLQRSAEPVESVTESVVEDVVSATSSTTLATPVLARRTLFDRKDFDEFQNKLQEATHVYVNATSGSGKSVLVNSYLQQNLGKDSKFIVLDPKPEGVANLKWQGAYKVVNDPTQFAEVLERVVGIMKKRQLKSHIENPLLTIVIDEFSVLNETAVEHVSVLLGRARSSNIKLVMLSQTTSAEFNGMKGRTDLFNGVTIVSLGFNERHDRVVSRAKISSGKLRKIGEDIVVPNLPVPWMEADRPFEDDSETFGFIIDDPLPTKVAKEVVTTTVVQDDSNAEMITKITEMLSELVGVDLTSVVEESRSRVIKIDVDELPPMLKETTEEDKNKYDFQPQEYNDKDVPPLKVTVGIIKNGNLRDSGMEKIGDMIITEGDIAAVKYLNSLFGESNNRKQISVLVFGTHSRYHYKAISTILGDK